MRRTKRELGEEIKPIDLARENLSEINIIHHISRLHELIQCANMITSCLASITVIVPNYRIKGNIWVRSKGT